MTAGHATWLYKPNILRVIRDTSCQTEHAACVRQNEASSQSTRSAMIKCKSEPTICCQTGQGAHVRQNGIRIQRLLRKLAKAEEFPAFVVRQGSQLMPDRRERFQTDSHQKSWVG